MNLRHAYLVSTLVMAWIAKATADGRVTAAEILDLAEDVAELLGVELDVDLRDAPQAQEAAIQRAREVALGRDR